MLSMVTKISKLSRCPWVKHTLLFSCICSKFCLCLSLPLCSSTNISKYGETLMLTRDSISSRWRTVSPSTNLLEVLLLHSSQSIFWWCHSFLQLLLWEISEQVTSCSNANTQLWCWSTVVLPVSWSFQWLQFCMSNRSLTLYSSLRTTLDKPTKVKIL